MLKIGKYSMGVGDRFGHQAAAQLSAIQQAAAQGVNVVPVWNKSFREHSIIGTRPADVQREVLDAVKRQGYAGEFHVDADHISLKNVDLFLDSSDFFTLDVADFTGHAASPDCIASFLQRHADLIGTPVAIPGLEAPLLLSQEEAAAIAAKYLLAVQEAGKIYRHIRQAKGNDEFVTEVSMDETDLPQTPREMLFILAAIADEQIPAQTIAPKFTGRFNKGVDYVGDLAQFEKEFNGDILVIKYAVAKFGLPANLKLSVHSGSDKFSLYPIINRALKQHGCGLHLKTAGTTWLEEIIGLAQAGGEGLQLAKELYRNAFGRSQELCQPYATVIDIQNDKLPAPATVDAWSSTQFCQALRHIQSCPDYNQHFRQLLHVGYKVAAEMGERYYQALEQNQTHVAANVAENILKRHLLPVFA